MSEEQTPTIESVEPVKSKGAILKEVFGDKYHGEVPVEEVEAVETVDETEEPTEELEAVEEAPEQEDTEEVEDGVDISTFSELIEANEWDPEWANTLKLSVKVDGQPTNATIKELVDSYQIQQAAEKRLEEAKAVRKAAQEEVHTRALALNEQLAIAQELVGAVEKSFKLELDSNEMKELRENDPAEYAARIADINSRKEALEQVKREAANRLNKAGEPLSQQAQAERQQRIQQQTQYFLDSIPEGSDPEKLQGVVTSMVGYAETMGFSKEQVVGAEDARLLVLLDKARRYDALQKTTDAAKKKVVKVPKVMKPGTPKTREQQSAAKLRELQDDVRNATGMNQIEKYVALRKAKRGN